jgi:hypothetical protein
MVEKVRPHKQNSFRGTSEFADIARSVAEVDDYVLQEFLTDIIDGGVGAPANGNGEPLAPGSLLQHQSSFGMSDFNPAFTSASPFPTMDINSSAMNVGASPLNVPADPSLFARGAGDQLKKQGKGKKSRRNSRVSNTGSDDDDDGDADVRRKRQREANLQAQRRCRERHRTHVTNLEAEVDALRGEANAAKAENARLQNALQRSLLGLEECQTRWQNMAKDKGDILTMKSAVESKLRETLDALRECSTKNTRLTEALRNSQSPSNSNPCAAPKPSGSSGPATIEDNTDHAPRDELENRIEEAMSGMDLTQVRTSVKAEPETFGELGGPLATQSLQTKSRPNLGTSEDESSAISLQQEAAALELALATNGVVSEEDMKRVALRLTRQFRTYLVDGNACASANAFSSPETDVSVAGPGQTRSVFKRAHRICKTLGLSDAQKDQIVRMWKTHSKKIHELFERRKKLTADALMLQGTSPVATLMDFLSIGSGTLSGVRNEEEFAELGGQMTLTGFAQHACRLQGVISELRSNIGAEQMQNFVLVSEVVDDVLTPVQTCTICATWGPECPDMLAISRAITVQTMEEKGAP